MLVLTRRANQSIVIGKDIVGPYWMFIETRSESESRLRERSTFTVKRSSKRLKRLTRRPP